MRHKADLLLGGRARRQVVVAFACVLALDSADKGAVAASATQLQAGLHVGKTGIGVLLAVSSVIGALATVPAGSLVDRSRRVRLLAGSIACWALAMAFAAAAANFGMLLVAHVALGIVSAVAGPALASLLGDFFPAEERGKVYGYIVGGELIGAGFGLVVAGNLAAVSWRASFVALIPPTALVWWLVHRVPEPARGGASRMPVGTTVIPSAGRVRGSAGGTPEDDDAPRGGLSLSEAVRVVLAVPTNVRLIVASALGYFFFSGLRGFAVEFAKDHYRIGQSTASTLTLVLGIGAVGGVLVGGRFADRLMRRGRSSARIEVPCAFALAAVAFIAPALLTRHIEIAVPLLVLAMFCLGGINPPLDAARLDVVPSWLWGRAEAIRSVLRNLADAGAPLAVGLISSHVLTGVSGLQNTFLCLLVTVVAAALILLAGRHRYPRDVAAAQRPDAPRALADQGRSRSTTTGR